MAVQSIISVGFDYKRTEIEKEKVLNFLKEVRDSIKDLNGMSFNGGSLAGLMKNEEQLAKVQEQLNRVTNDYLRLQEQVNKGANESAGNTKKQLDAFQQLVKSQKEAEQSANALAVSLGNDSDEYKRAAENAALLKKQIEDIKATTKAGGSITVETPVVDQTRDVQKQVSAYEALVQQQKEAEATARALAVQYGAESEEAKKAAQANIELKTRIEEAKKAAASQPVSGNTQTVSTQATNVSIDYSSLAEEGKAVDEATKRLVRYQFQLAEVQQRQKELNKVVAEDAAASEKLMLAKAALVKEETDLKTAIALTKNEISNEGKIASELANDYLQLSKAYNDAALRAKNYALTLGEQHPVTQDAIKDARAMHDTLLRLDQSVGDSRRNVGNYKSAFDGLGMSFTQLTREFPSLAVSSQTFLLAISNNLPMVQDEIAKARAEIAALRAQGEETPGLFQRITSSLLSAQVGFSLLITAVTVFGPKLIEMISGFFNADAALLRLIEDQTKYNKVLEDTAGLQDKVNKNVFAFYNTLNQRRQEQISLIQAQGLSEDTLAVKQAENAKKRMQDIQNEGTIILEQSKRNQFLLGLAPNQDRTRAVIDGVQKLNGELLVEQQSYADKLKKIKQQIADANPADEDNMKLLEAQKNNVQSFLDLNEQSINRNADLISNYYEAISDSRNKDAEMAKHFDDEERKRILGLTELEVSLVKAKNQNILNDTRSSLEQRLAAISSNAEAEKRLLASQRNDVLNDPGSTAVDKLLAEQTYRAKISELIIQKNAESFAVEEDYRKRAVDADKEMYDLRYQELQNFYTRASQNNGLSLEQRLGALKKAQDAEEEMIQTQYLADIAKLQNTDQTGKEIEAAEAKHQQQLTELVRRNEEQRLALLKAYNDKVQQEASQANNALTNAIQSVNVSDAETAEQYAKDVTNLDESLQKKEISLRGYNRKRKELDDNYNIYSLSSQIAKDKKVLAETKLTFDQEQALRKKIALSEKELADEQLKQYKQALQERKQLEEEFVQDVINLGKTIGDASFQRQIDNYERLKQASDDYYNREIQNISESARIGAISDREAADRTTILNAEKEAAADQLDRKEREIKIKQARFDKAAAIADIIAKAAQAEMAATSYLTNVLTAPLYPAIAALIAATSAAQIATVLATPIPQYKDGLKGNKPAHLGIYGEAGPELIEKPGIAPFVADKATLDYLPAGTRIKPLKPIKHDDIDVMMNRSMVTTTARLLQVQEQEKKNNNSTDDRVLTAINNQTRQFIKALKSNKPSVHIHDNSAYIAWKNSRLNW